jgi:TonB-linked SusC/RagA family outer membrane protein
LAILALIAKLIAYMKKLVLGFLLTLTTIGLYAQNITVTGKVTDESGAPLDGVSIKLKGSTTGAQTNSGGTFQIAASVGATLTFSYVGYTSQDKKVSAAGPISVTLVKTNANLDEVVVIGYQSVRRKDVMASIASVGAKDLKDIPINSAAEALNGRLAGVTASTAEGSPDADVRIRVRGGMSITGDNSPLYILDGVQVENALSLITPQDIQSIDVLKDASATAIYGARGANGVIVITTKNGRPGKMQVTYNAFYGVKNLARELGVLSPYDYAFYQYERQLGNATDSATFAKNFGTFNDLEALKSAKTVNWQKQAFGNTGILQTHNLSLFGGTKKFNYNFGITSNEDKAVVRNSGLRRGIITGKIEYKPTEKLKLTLSTRYNYQDVYGAGVSSTQGSSYNRLRNAVRYRPYLSANQDLDDPDPLADPAVGNGLNLINPIELADQEFRKKSTEVKNVTASLTYNILKNLSFTSTFGYNDNFTVDRKFSDSLTPYSVLQGSKKPIMGKDTVQGTTITNSNVLSYNYNKGNHNFTALVGQETYQLDSRVANSLYRLYPNGTSPDDALKYRVMGTTFPGFPKLQKSVYTNMSFFTRLTYSYKDKYMFSMNARADGASKFSETNRWGYFPSGSFAWRIKKEKFLDNVDAISDMKLRVGYGAVGNNRISDYLYLSTYNNNGSFYYGLGGQTSYGYSSAGLVNANLLWESTISRNIGLDISFLKRFSLTVDAYNNSSSNLLLNVPIASTYGYSTQLQNIGKTSNKGIEFNLTALVASAAEFTWNASLNMSFNKNTVEALGVNQQAFFPAASWGVSGQPTDYIAKIGQPVGAMFGLVADGMYRAADFDYNSATRVYTLKAGVVNNSAIIGTVQPGSIKYKDLNGDGKIDLTNDRTIIGNPTPKFSGGFNNQFAYKNWDMSIFVNFVYGNTIYNASKVELTNGYTNNANMLDMMKGRWKTVSENGTTLQYVNGSGQVIGVDPAILATANINATIWQPLKSTGAFYPSSWAMEDGSFIRINNLTIGHTVSSKQLSKLKISKLRFYLTGNNLAVFTNYTGYDPEVSVSNNGLTPGLDYSAYPKSRSFVFGLNATF